jgi:hypothetical protein
MTVARAEPPDPGASLVGADPGADALQVLTRAQQDAIWDKLTLTSPIRSLLKMFFPRCVRGDEQIIKIHGPWVSPSGSSSSR